MKCAIPCGLAIALLTGVAGAASVSLTGETSGAFRWLDISDQEYSAAYQAGYSYTQASVVVTYAPTGTVLRGTLTATNLKPFFAYQLKLEGWPEGAAEGNEELGLTGRWWEQEWVGAWSAGWNLNSKGDGSSPNPNDVVYWANVDVINTNSITGKHYRYTGYQVFDYFITDVTGAATVPFVVRNSYHVLWKTSQTSHGSGDGPIRSLTFDPDPTNHPAYSTDYPQTTTSIFGEWERLPAGKLYLSPCTYIVNFLLTEESFHQSGSVEGYWAHAARGSATFTIVPPTITASTDPPTSGAISPSGSVEVACGYGTNFTMLPGEHWELDDVSVDGESVGATNEWQFTDVTNHHTIVMRSRPLLATNDVPRWWLAQYGVTSNWDGAAVDDPDTDGMHTWREYYADTDPTKSTSVLAVARVAPTADGVRLYWHGGMQATQFIESCLDLAAPQWLTILTNTPPTSPTNSLLVPATTNGPTFYRLRCTR